MRRMADFDARLGNLLLDHILKGNKRTTPELIKKTAPIAGLRPIMTKLCIVERSEEVRLPASNSAQASLVRPDIAVE
jgi:hypothetical protein